MELEGSEQLDIYTAANNGNIERIKELLQKGIDVNGNQNEFNGTPLTCAARNGHADCVNFLVEAGADVNCRDDASALYYAIIYGLDDCVDILLENGAETEGIDSYDCAIRTPLMMAAVRGELKCLSLLL